MHTLKIPRVLLELTLYEPLGPVSGMCHSLVSVIQHITGRERLVRSHSSARFSFELSGNSN